MIFYFSGCRAVSPNEKEYSADCQRQGAFANGKTYCRALEAAEPEITRRVKGEWAELRGGTQCVFCYKWLPQVVSAFQEKFPQVEISVGNADGLVSELEERGYDLIITRASASDEKFPKTILFNDQLDCLLEKNIPWPPIVMLTMVIFAETFSCRYLKMGSRLCIDQVVCPPPNGDLDNHLLGEGRVSIGSTN